MVFSLFTILSLTQFLATGESFTKIPCAEKLASYRGVPARSNHNYPYGSCGGKSVYGLRYQCVEFVRRFYHLVKGIETRDGMMGESWKDDADSYFHTAAEKGLQAFENGGPVPPRPDDILTFHGGPFGHVAIVTAVTGEYVEFIEQNLSRSGIGRLPYNVQTHRVLDRHVPGGKLILEGWLRPHSS